MTGKFFVGNYMSFFMGNHIIPNFFDAWVITERMVQTENSKNQRWAKVGVSFKGFTKECRQM